MKKRIIAFITGTAALLAVAIGWQAFGVSSRGEDQDPRPPAVSTETPQADPSESERDGFTEDQTDKPGENKN